MPTSFSLRRLVLPLLALCCFAQIAAAQSTIFLVRHAEKAEAGAADPQDPDLSEAGRARADSLATTLKDARLTAIYATEFKRTQQTAAPSAQAAGLTTKFVPGKKTAALLAKLRSARGNVLVVGHSNTLPEIIQGLSVSAPVVIGETDYDNLFLVIRSTPPRFIRLHYR